jgi:hypothetical protein
MFITVLLIYILYKSVQLQHIQSLLFVILSSLVIARYRLLTMEILYGQPQAARHKKIQKPQFKSVVNICHLPLFLDFRNSSALLDMHIPGTQIIVFSGCKRSTKFRENR